MRLHPKPTMGGAKLDKLTALRVQSMYSQKLGAGLSARSVEIIHAVLHKALKRAVRWALVPRNIAEAVTPPRPTTAAGDNAPANHSAGFNCVVTNVELVSSSGDLYATYNGQSVLLPQTPPAV